jgi:hypothetical protein
MDKSNIYPIEFQRTFRSVPKQAPSGVERETLRIILTMWDLISPRTCAAATMTFAKIL